MDALCQLARSARRGCGFRVSVRASLLLSAGLASACAGTAVQNVSARVDAPAAPPSGPREPSVSAHGSDVSSLPALHPSGEWVAIEAPLLSMAVIVRVLVNGQPALATLDTGAMGTTMSTPVAERLGILQEDTPRGRPVRAIDAHGDVIMGEKIDLGEIAIGRHRWVDVETTVVGEQPDLFLIGADVLQDVDLYLAADEGLVGLFDAGRGPVEGGDRVVTLIKNDRQLQALASVQTASTTVEFPLIVDTGAWNTSVPLLAGINGGVPADVGYDSTTMAVGGEQTSRGRFVLEPLRLGRERTEVGRVLAIGSTLEREGGTGLLGNDVLMREHTLVSFARGELRIKSAPARPAFRTRGPGAVACSDDSGNAAPCVSVALVARPEEAYEPADLPNVCLRIHVDEVYAGKTLELAITGTSPALMNGGAIRAFLTANDKGADACFHLWQQLGRLGVDASTPLSLRWVRTEGVQWPCDPMKTRCITFTGPLAKLPVK